MINEKLKFKNHWAVSDYLQRSARHIASKTDLLHAEAVGIHAVKYAVKGLNGVMPVIVRGKGKKYSWKIEPAPLSKIANVEKKLPKSFISKDGFNVNSKAIAYLNWKSYKHKYDCSFIRIPCIGPFIPCIPDS